ncbi:MAG TPA: hypothetical protein VH054_11660 [Polyangiaceae bacterium]|nr:hypothetical protein [Polyangiaceae bacterium]
MIAWLRRQRLFVLCVVTFAFFYQGGDENQATRIFLARAIVERGAPDITPNAGHLIDKGRIGQRYFSDKAPLVSWIATVPYALTRVADRLFRVPRNRATERVRVHVLAASISGVCGAIATWFVHATLVLLGATRRRAAFVAVGYALGTLVFPYSTVLYGHVVAAMLVAWSFWVIVRSDAGGLFDPRAAATLGALWSLSTICEYPTALLCAVQAIAIAPRVWRTKTWPWILAGAAPSVVLHAAFAFWAFGSPFVLPYRFVAEPFFRARMSTGFLGLDHPTLARLYGVLLSPYRGLFFFCPFLVLSFAGFGDWLVAREHRRALAICAASVVVYVLFAGSYYAWDGGLSTSCRHLVPALAFFVVPIAWFLRGSSARVWIAVFALAASIAIMLACTAVLVEQREGPMGLMNPFYDTVVPRFVAGQLGTNWIDLDHQGPRGDASYNLATLLGLGPVASLLLLGCVWLAAYRRDVARWGRT